MWEAVLSFFAIRLSLLARSRTTQSPFFSPEKMRSLSRNYLLVYVQILRSFRIGIQQSSLGQSLLFNFALFPEKKFEFLTKSALILRNPWNVTVCSPMKSKVHGPGSEVVKLMPKNVWIENSSNRNSQPSCFAMYQMSSRVKAANSLVSGLWPNCKFQNLTLNFIWLREREWY